MRRRVAGGRSVHDHRRIGRHRRKTRAEPAGRAGGGFGLHVREARPDRGQHDHRHDQLHAGPGIQRPERPQHAARRRPDHQRPRGRRLASRSTRTASTPPRRPRPARRRCSSTGSRCCAARRAPSTAATRSAARSTSSPSARPRTPTPRSARQYQNYDHFILEAAVSGPTDDPGRAVPRSARTGRSRREAGSTTSFPASLTKATSSTSSMWKVS